MSVAPRRPPSTDAAHRRRRQRSGSLRWPFWLGLLLLAGASAWFMIHLGRGNGPGRDDFTVADETAEAEVPVGDRAVVLVFPEWDGAGYVTERRRISSRGRAEEDLLSLLQQLCEGPARSGAISALPRRTAILGAFLDPQGEHAVLDFSSELVVLHPGGSAAEAATLTSILRTVALNFPGLQTCRILVDGAEVESLGGHLILDGEFDLRRWL
ncbi:MAG: GerMN domain-containing protein [Candidatus Krumholzibacteriia bacterium]